MMTRKKLHINAKCVNTIRELQTYVWDEKAAQRGEEKPLKINDHVAVVSQGRAGHSVSIKDSKPTPKKEKKSMPKENMLHKMFAVFAKDAEPDDILKAAKTINDCSEGKEPTHVGSANGFIRSTLPDALSAVCGRRECAGKKYCTERSC